jgi:ribosome-binding protein aMBF1 (putative translation factor)
MATREIKSCDHCGKDINGKSYSIIAFDAERDLCIDCASDFEMWIKPVMASVSGKVARIMIEDKPK